MVTGIRLFDGAAVPIWGLIAALALCMGLAFAARGLTFEWWSFLAVVLVATAFLSLSAFYTVVRPDERLARLPRAMAELFLLGFCPGMLSYAAASLGLPLWDATFLAWDRAIGFEWRFWLAVLDANPPLHWVLALAYHSFLLQLVAVIILLVTMRLYRELDVFLLAFGIACAVTVAVAATMPALSPIAHLGITAADHPNITLAVPLQWVDHAQSLRSGTMRIIDITKGEGIVTFPSFHTAGGVLFVLAVRHLPFVRWAGLALNGLMLVSVPIEGSHYLVDLSAGVLVALVSYGAAQSLVVWDARRRTFSSMRLLPAE